MAADDEPGLEQFARAPAPRSAARPRQHSPAGPQSSRDLAPDFAADRVSPGKSQRHNLSRLDRGETRPAADLTNIMSRCDLHIHSRHSARSEEWLFRRFDFPDSYSDPKQLYEQLRKSRMDYVTITDHDSIDGCLEIAHLPGTFISEQVTTYFPLDACKLHILVWGISEQQHRDIERIRENIFDLQRYLQRAQITHAVAHPLYSVNGKLEAMHLEQLILLFKH